MRRTYLEKSLWKKVEPNKRKLLSNSGDDKTGINKRSKINTM